MSKLIVKTLIFAALAVFVSKTGMAADEIYRTTHEKPLVVDRVTVESYTEVKFRKTGGSEQRLSADKVIRIVYGDQPDAYKRGLRFHNDLDFENAVNSLKLAMEKKSGRPWIQTYSYLWIAKSYQAWGATDQSKYRDAIAAYEDLLRKDAKTRFYAEVLLGMAKCYSFSGDLSNAVKTCDRLGKEAYDKKLGVIWEAYAKFEKAQAKLAAKQFDEAERDFRSSLTFSNEQAGKATDPALVAELKRLSGLAGLARGAVLIKKKNYREAKSFFNSILNDENSSVEALAGAQNGLGECSLAEKRLKDAQSQFARAKVAYGSVVDEAAKATYYLGVCCLELKNKEPKSKMKARNYFEEVVSRYGSSIWAKEARKMLK
jgi:tetratricopeptide (TPR) repeat protein